MYLRPSTESKYVGSCLYCRTQDSWLFKPRYQCELLPCGISRARLDEIGKVNLFSLGRPIGCRRSFPEWYIQRSSRESLWRIEAGHVGYSCRSTKVQCRYIDHWLDYGSDWENEILVVASVPGWSMTIRDIFLLKCFQCGGVRNNLLYSFPG